MRNPDYQFFNMDITRIIADLESNYTALTGVSVRPASVEKLFIHWIANIIIQERELTNYAANQNIPSRAVGNNLDALAELFFNQIRAPAKKASCVTRFYISTIRTSAVLIPAGTRVTDSNQTLYWETTQDAYIPAGETYLDIAVTCQTAGTVGNGWSAGQIHTAIDIYDYYSRCENITISDGGADEQSDDELYQSILQSMFAPSTAGSRGGYIYHAKSVSTEIADVAVQSPAPGEIRIYALMKSGDIASETIKQAIYDKCNADDVRPLADHVEMANPDIIYYQIKFTYYLPSGAANYAEISNAVENAVENYIAWQSEKFGRDINPSYLIGLLMQTGVKRVELQNPTFTRVPDGSDIIYTPSVALIDSRDRDIIIINGGVED